MNDTVSLKHTKEECKAYELCMLPGRCKRFGQS